MLNLPWETRSNGGAHQYTGNRRPGNIQETGLEGTAEQGQKEEYDPPPDKEKIREKSKPKDNKNCQAFI